MIGLPTSPEVVKALAFRQALQATAEWACKVAKLLADGLAAAVRRVLEALERVRPVLLFMANRQSAVAYGYTGPTLTGRELAHWRKIAGRPRRRR